MMYAFDFEPVIIIGAARSGTNMLRDLLTQLPGVATWPCDEINYVWRYGNASFLSDELTPAMVTPRTERFIRGQFVKMAERTGARWVVEKTCANSLRVDFVRKIVPEAKFVFLIRDGLDVAASASKRWHAPLDLSYVLRKAAYVPSRELPYYAGRYLGHRMRRLLDRQRQLPTWGPRFTGIDEIVKTHASLESCVWQWKASVEAASSALVQLPYEQVCRVRYEEFVRQPAEGLLRLCDFLQIRCSPVRSRELTASVFADSVGSGNNATRSDDLRHLQHLIQQTLEHVERQWTNRDQIPTRTAV